MLDIKELFQYAHIVRSRFAAKLSELTWEEVCKNREASFYSMKSILLHMIDNEDWMINWVIKGKQDQYVRKSWDDYTSMEQIIKHMTEVETKTYEYFNSLNNEELNRKVTLKIREREFILTVEECLLQSFTEQLYHIGELIALLWQMNIEPPHMQWFWNNPREVRK